MNKNPYEVLGVARDATDTDIKKAYHKLVMKYHPDKNPGDKSAEEKFKEVNNAFDILKDPQKRAAYDRFGDAAFAGGNGASAGAGFGGNPFGNGSFHFNMGGGDMGGMEDIYAKPCVVLDSVVDLVGTPHANNAAAIYWTKSSLI